jgi:Protein of unknown function (DUF4242)
MQHYIVEHEYQEPLSDEQHNAEGMRADPCLRQYGVKWHGSFLAVDRRRMICNFEAESAEQIRDALRSADVKFVRVWPVHRFLP